MRANSALRDAFHRAGFWRGAQLHDVDDLSLTQRQELETDLKDGGAVVSARAVSVRWLEGSHHLPLLKAVLSAAPHATTGTVGADADVLPGVAAALRDARVRSLDLTVRELGDSDLFPPPAAPGEFLTALHQLGPITTGMQLEVGFRDAAR